MSEFAPPPSPPIKIIRTISFCSKKLRKTIPRSSTPRWLWRSGSCREKLNIRVSVSISAVRVTNARPPGNPHVIVAAASLRACLRHCDDAMPKLQFVREEDAPRWGSAFPKIQSPRMRDRCMRENTRESRSGVMQRDAIRVRRQTYTLPPPPPRLYKFIIREIHNPLEFNWK